MKIKILGIDPSLRNFGLCKATIDLHSLGIEVDDLILASSESESGKVVRKNSDDLRRASVLHEALQLACVDATFAIAEVPVGSQSSRAMASYGICVGVLSSCPIPLIQVTPSEVKLVAVGSKTASKSEMIEWAMLKYPAAPWLTRKLKGQVVPTADNEHLADAIAAIHAGVLTDQFKQARALMRSSMAA